MSNLTYSWVLLQYFLVPKKLTAKGLRSKSRGLCRLGGEIIYDFVRTFCIVFFIDVC